MIKLRQIRYTLAVAALLVTTPALAFDLEGHRGTRGLAPENTLPAFARALSLGVTTLEFDIGVTRDGVPVVIHDRALNPSHTRGPDGAWLEGAGPTVASLSLAELQRYDVGAIRPGTSYAKQFPDQMAVPGTPVPTLAALLALVERSGNREVRLDIETKLSPLAPDEAPAPEAFAALLVEALKAAGMAERATIQSFDWRTLQAVQRLAPSMPTAYLTVERGRDANVVRGAASSWTAGFNLAAHGGSLPRTIKAAGGAIWSANYRDLRDDELGEAHALGLKVLAWTVNDPAEMRALIERGVDGIITDYPDRLRAVMAEKGLPLPAPTPVDAAAVTPDRR